MNKKIISPSLIQHLALEFVSVTECAALAAAQWIGKGDKKAADQAAVDAMRDTLNKIYFRGEIVIGEGEKDESAELYIGERMGNGEEPFLDIAVDPLECTSSVAFGRPNAMTVMAIGPRGTLYKAIDSYVEKVAVGPGAVHAIDLNASPSENIYSVARALGKDVSEITVAILDRERHQALIQEVRKAGARVQLFTDGDIAMALAPSFHESSVDMLLGVGGSTEAVLASAALRCTGGELLCRWKPKDDVHSARLRAAGITDFSQIFRASDLAKGDDLAFIATGVIMGPLLDGVAVMPEYSITHSVCMSLKPQMKRFIKTEHFAKN